jgi:hypothetical protein
MKKNYLLPCIISLVTLLAMNAIDYVTPVSSQSGEGLKITPSVQWSENVEGTFSYCVYEGTVTLDSVNDPQAFCVIPTSDGSFDNMQSLVDDNIEIYEMTSIHTPAGLFKDGAPYSVCVTFYPFSSENAGFNSVSSCQQFTNKKGSHPEEPFINLDDGSFFTNG